MPYNPISANNLRGSGFPEGVKGGRRPNKLKKLIKDYDLSKQDLEALFKMLLVDKTKAELKKLAADDDPKSDKQLAITALLAEILLKSAKKGDAGPINSMFDRLYGKPTQQVDVVSKTGIPDNIDDIRAYRKQLEERAKVLHGIDAGTGA